MNTHIIITLSTVIPVTLFIIKLYKEKSTCKEIFQDVKKTLQFIFVLQQLYPIHIPILKRNFSILKILGLLSQLMTKIFIKGNIIIASILIIHVFSGHSIFYKDLILLLIIPYINYNFGKMLSLLQENEWEVPSEIMEKNQDKVLEYFPKTK